MGNGIFSKFNFYDQVGYLLVGCIALFVIALDFHLMHQQAVLPPLTAEWLVVWVVVAYFVGHVTQAVSNLIIREDKTAFSEQDKVVLEEARKYFGLDEGLSLNSVYLHCYMLTCAKDVTGQVNSFNAYYSMYRGWFTIFILETAFLAGVIILGPSEPSHIVFAAIALPLAVLMYMRARRFYKYSRSKTMQTFVLIRKLEKTI